MCSSDVCHCFESPNSKASKYMCVNNLCAYLYCRNPSLATVVLPMVTIIYLVNYGLNILNEKFQR